MPKNDLVRWYVSAILKTREVSDRGGSEAELARAHEDARAYWDAMTREEQDVADEWLKDHLRGKIAA